MSPQRVPPPHDTPPITGSQRASFGAPPLQRLLTNPPLKDPEIQRYVLLIVGLFLAVSTGFFMWLHHRNRLMPAPSKRYDITELYLAPTEDLCPGLSKDPQRKALETCILGLSLPSPEGGALKKVLIPKLEDTPLQSYPRLIDLFAAQGLGHFKEAFLKAQDFIVGIQVPFGYFTPDIVNSDPFTLAMAQVRRGRFCYLGQCPFQIDRHSYVAVGPPLFDFYNELSQKNVPKTTMIPVWIYLADLTSTIGINLEHGIFVAPSSELRAARFIHGPIVQGLAFISAFTGLGITLMALVFAWNRKRYLDTAAFVVLACMLYINTLIEPYLFSFGNLPIDPNVRRTIVNLGEIQLLIAALFFGWSTSRPPTRTFWLSYTFATSCALIVAPLILASISADFTRDYLALVLGLMQFLIPALICLGTWRLKSPLGEGLLRFSPHRVREQIFFALTLGILGLIPLLEAIQKLQGLSTYPIISLRGLALIPIFGALLYAVLRKKPPLFPQDESHTILEKKGLKTPQQGSFKTQLDEAMGMFDIIAHDVRKPFSMIKAGLNVLGSHSSPDSALAQTLDHLTQEVHRSLTEVDHLMGEVMRFKRFSSAHTGEQVVPNDFSMKLALREALQEVFKYESSYQYTFFITGKEDALIKGHQADFVASLSTLIRILLPLGSNEEKEGALYVETAPSSGTSSFDDKKPKDSIVLSFWILTPKKIPESEQKLFTSTHPMRPTSKTKLRLRNSYADLARFGHMLKGISIHIKEAQQYKLGWTLELRIHSQPPPASDSLRKYSEETSTLDSPTSVSDIDTAHPSRHPFRSLEASRPWPKSSLELSTAPKGGSRIHDAIMIVDDEKIYTEAVHQLIMAQAGPHSTLKVSCFTGLDEAWEYVNSNSVSLVICDIDFTNSVGPSPSRIRDGIEFTALLKKQFPQITAVLHSNRSLSLDHPDLLRSKADFFVAKPMTLKDLNQFVSFSPLQSAASSASTSSSTSTNPHLNPASQTTSKENINQIAIVDDDIFIREAWVQKMGENKTLSFASVEAMLAHLTEDPSSAPQIELIVLDQYLEGGMTGLEFAAKIRRGETPLSAQIPLILSSDAFDSIEKDPQKRALVDLVLSKDPVSYGELRARLPRKP